MSPKQLVFNQKVTMDLIWLQGVPILHVIDVHAGYQNAITLRSKRAADVWDAFLECWTSV